jgi:hypothetical protein
MKTIEELKKREQELKAELAEVKMEMKRLQNGGKGHFLSECYGSYPGSTTKEDIDSGLYRFPTRRS